MKTVYIHIGIGKTGTSAIQKVLYSEREAFLKHDLFIPLTGLNYDNLGHHRLANYQESLPSNVTKDLYGELLAEISASSQSNILISSELYCYCKSEFIDFISKSFQGFSVKIILYVREQVSLVESTFLWWQAQGYDYKYNIDDFFEMAKGGFNYQWMIKSWVDKFGESAIIVKVYDRKLIGGRTLSYFFEGVYGEYICEDSPEVVNKSLLPCFSSLVSFLDKSFPELLKGNSDCLEARKKIIQKLIDAPDNKDFKVEDLLLEIELFLTATCTTLSFHSCEWGRFKDEYIKKFDIKERIVSEFLKKKILHYYKGSNFEISYGFDLKSKQRKSFLKYYYSSIPLQLYGWFYMLQRKCFRYLHG